MEKVSSSNSQGVRVPKLRFPGFEGEWAERKLGDISIVNPTTKDIPNQFYYIDLESVTGGVLSKLIIVNKSEAPSRAQRVVETGDVLFQTVRPYQQNNYLVSGEFELPVVASTGYAQIRTEENQRFLYSLLHTKSFLNEVLLRCTGSSYPAINSNDLKEISTFIPERKEQKRIAELMQLLEERIAKQRQLVEALKSYKRGLSTALFTRRIRIANAGESQLPEWKKRSLGEVFSERKERARGDEKLLAVTINNGVQDRESLELKDNSSEDKTNYKVVHIGDLAYNSMRMWQGACGVSSYDGIVSPAYTVVFVVDPEMDYAPFWGYYFKEISMLHTFQRNSQGLTSDTWNLKYDKFSKIIVNTPCLEEQVRIASLIDHVSNAIIVNEEVLDRLFNYKRGLLAGMFI